jgi:RNA polymerase sigma-70 factor, ECF subfamily
LLEKLRRGDERAWTRFFKEYEGRIITMCVAMTRDQGVAEEICADTFVRVVSSIDEFREGSSIKTWIYTIARNLCLTHLARAKQTVALDDEMADVLPDRSPGAEQAVADQEVDTVLQEAIGELDPSLREALLLRVTGDLSYAEIARTMGVPVATVATRVHRAREQLRRRLARVL